MKLLIVTGISGAGKSHALKKLEDLGYHCIDNMPIDLIGALVDLALKSVELRDLALGIDSRSGISDGVVKCNLEAIAEKGIQIEILFLDASDVTLLRRFSETRRVHPLARDGIVQNGIDKEREQLEYLESIADYHIDTSGMKPAKLGEAIEQMIIRKKQSFNIILSSFGFKYGSTEADILFDVRFVPNPYWVDNLKSLSGLDEPVREYVLGFEQTKKFMQKAIDMIEYLIPFYQSEGKHLLHVALGCTGGRHRSVCLAECMKKELALKGYDVQVIHRNIDS